MSGNNECYFESEEQGCKFTVNRGLGGFSPLENLRILGIELQKSMLFAV